MTKKIISKNLDKNTHKEFVGKLMSLALFIEAAGMFRFINMELKTKW